MFSLVLECRREDSERLLADLYERGTSGAQEEELPGGSLRLRAFFEDDGLAAAYEAEFCAYGAKALPEEPCDWVEVAHQYWEPVEIGERIYLTPAWRDDPTPSGRLRLVMPPGLASGTGLHPATQLALAAMERFVVPGDRVLDLGTGSGILAAAASLLGAGEVYACDIDLDAVRAATAYLGEQKVNALLYAGSARSLQDGSMGLVVANINALTLVALAGEIARVLRTNGVALLAGFRPEDRTRLLMECESQGLLPEAAFEDGGWACKVFRRRAPL